MSLVNQFNSLQNSYIYNIGLGTNIGIVGSTPILTTIDGISGFNNDFFTLSGGVLTCVKSGYYEFIASGFLKVQSMTSSGFSSTVQFGIFKDSIFLSGVEKVISSIATYPNSSAKFSSVDLFGAISVTNTTSNLSGPIDISIRHRGKIELGETIALKRYAVASGASVGGEFDMIGSFLVSKYA